jgi:FkbM family methyltransferase
LVRQSVPDPVEIHDKLWHGFRGQCGWDVGANCGQTILDMAFEFDEVVAFEPSPDSFAAATELVRVHGLRAQVHCLALSDQNGTIALAYPGREQRETGQLVTIGLQGMEWEPEDWGAVEQATVPCQRADTIASVFGYPDFMKVDTEGHEVLVLVGASQVLGAGYTDFLVEFHSPGNRETCESMLRGAGCDVEVVRHPHYPEGSRMWHQHGWIRAFAPRRGGRPR